jgi:MFS family permease
MLAFFRDMWSFLVLLGGQSVSRLGSSMVSYALILWVYEQDGTASSVAMLSFCTFLPSVLFAFIAGTFIDKWDKKRVMLLSDCVAALGTITVFALHSEGALLVWHLYAVNFTISFMGAFQAPASYVATSLLVPKEHYARASGLQSLSQSLVSILSPIAATAILAFGGLKTVLVCDLVTFALAFSSLLLIIKLPSIPITARAKDDSLLRQCTEGLRFLWARRLLFKIILYMSMINLLSYITGYGVLPVMILARSGDSQTALGLVSSAMGIGLLAGSMLTTLMKPTKNKTKTVFLVCAFSFLFGDILWGVGRNLVAWVLAAFLCHALVPLIGACLSTIMRMQTPIEMQGRVFAARDTLQHCTIPLGLFLGGFLADSVFEPFMSVSSPLQGILSSFAGLGRGSGMAVMFTAAGVLGIALSIACLTDRSYQQLE